jgi:hypothetical protein
VSDSRPAPAAPRPSPIEDPEAAAPSEALAEVWDLLDALPDAAASPAMMATTMEMAAAPAAGGPRRGAAAGWEVARWLPAAAVVLAALAIGIAAGRSTLPNPETGILANLPFVQNLDLLREAGSVGFLEELARREYPAPRRPPPAQSPATVLADLEKFDAAVASLRGADADGGSKDVVAARREQVLALPERERRQLEKSVETYLRLSGSDRRELVAVGRALADPARTRLAAAARLWHQWIQLRDPADRRDVIDLGTSERIEWLDRMTRFDARMEVRGEAIRQFYERDPRRRPPGPRGLDPRAGEGAADPRAGEGRGRPPLNRGEPAAPAETPPPPR